jgi:hypothetical protein
VNFIEEIALWEEWVVFTSSSLFANTFLMLSIEWEEEVRTSPVLGILKSFSKLKLLMKDLIATEPTEPRGV